jgi:large subunit ribosomal protein L32e
MPEDKKKVKKTEVAADKNEQPKEASKSKKADKFKPRSKPELTQDEKAAMAMRIDKKDKTPHFRRQEWFRYKKLDKDKWRKPRGLHSKMRRHIGYRQDVVSIGYRGPKLARGKHPSGFEEVMVHNLNDMQGLDSKRQAIRIAHSVGYLKRLHIAIKADELNLRILNFSRAMHDELLEDAKKRGITPLKDAPTKEAKK